MERRALSIDKEFIVLYDEPGALSTRNKGSSSVKALQVFLFHISYISFKLVFVLALVW